MRSVCFILMLALASCENAGKRETSVEKHSAHENGLPKNEQIKNLKKTVEEINAKKEEDKNQRLRIIRKLIATHGFIKLPYTYHFNSDSLGGISNKTDNELHDELLKTKLPFSRFIGVLPDTTNNFYVVGGLAASVWLIEIITINKMGEKIYQDGILENNCLHYVEDDIYCIEYLTISDNLKMDYYYKSKYVYGDQNDTICSLITKKGHIIDDGKVEFYERIEEKCQ